MKVKVANLDKVGTKQVELPIQFNEVVRGDLIKKAFLAIQNNKRQPYGINPEAGKGYSVRLSKKRRDYRGSYGYGISRTPRKILVRRGRHFYWVGAFAPNTVGGRRAHPPKAEKIWDWKLNIKERRLAIRSALSATINRELVISRGHKVPNTYPFILATDFENIAKTKDFVKSLIALGFQDELERVEYKKVRAGKGKSRARPYRKKKGLLIVVSSKDVPLFKAASNIQGFNVVEVKNLNVELLAPGAQPGRATLFTEQAIEILRRDKLFLDKTAIKSSNLNIAKELIVRG